MLFRKWRWCAEVREPKRANDSGEFGVVVDEGDDAHFSSTVGALQGVQFIELFDAPCPERGGFLGPVEKCRPAAFLGPDSADAESK